VNCCHIHLPYPLFIPALRYDAVTTEGKLEWQNHVTPLNQPYMDACDAIYLNYGCVCVGAGRNCISVRVSSSDALPSLPPCDPNGIHPDPVRRESAQVE
jgi:hypothetical protein